MNIPEKLKNNIYIDPIKEFIQLISELKELPLIGSVNIYYVYSWTLKSYKQYNILINYSPKDTLLLKSYYYYFNKDLLSYIKKCFQYDIYFILPFYKEMYFQIHNNILTITSPIDYATYVGEDIIKNVYSYLLQNNFSIIESEWNDYFSQFINIYKSYQLLKKI